MAGLGSGPIQPEFREHMRSLAEALDEVFNGDVKREERKTGFVLLVFEFGVDRGGHRCNYISNANREDVVTLLKEQLAYFEGQSDTLQGTA